MGPTGTHAPQTADGAGRAGQGRALWLMAALIALAVLSRLPALTYPHPIDDEGVYGVVANEIVDGGLPYRDAVERKPPLLFYTYAAVFKVAGKSNWLALHGAATVWLLATMAGIRLLGSRVFTPGAGFAAAAAYCLFLPWAVWRNLAFNGEMLMNLPVVWAWAIALGPSWSRRRVELAAAGALSGVAFLLKQPAAIAAVPLVVYVWLPEYRVARQLSWRDSLKQTAWFAAGGAVVLAATIAFLADRGILADAVYWTIGDHDVPHIFWMRALLFTSAFAAACLPLLVGSWAALRGSELWQGRGAEKTALSALLVVSAIGAAASGRFYPHYYIQMLPALALLAGAAHAGLTSARLSWPPVQRAMPLMYVWVTASLLAFATSHWVSLGSRRAIGAPGRYVREHSRPDDRIFVWGQAPQVYLDAGRRPASRYIATFPLTGYIFGGPLPGVDTRNRILVGSWQTLEHDFGVHPPAFIVDTEVRPDALYPMRTFPVLAAMVARDFEPVFRTDDAVVYRRCSNPRLPRDPGR